MKPTKADLYEATRFYETSYDSLDANGTITALAQLLARTRAEAVPAPAPKPAKRTLDWRLVAKSGKVVARYATEEAARWHAGNWVGGIVVENVPAKKRSRQ